MSLLKSSFLLFLYLLLLESYTYISILIDLCLYGPCELICGADLRQDVLSEIVAVIICANLLLTLLELAQVLLKLCQLSKHLTVVDFCFSVRFHRIVLHIN